MGFKITCVWAQTSVQKLCLKGNKEVGPIKDIKDLGPPHMPKHKGPGRGPGSPHLRSR